MPGPDTTPPPNESVLRRFAEARVARFATVTVAGEAHVVPCCFALVDNLIVSAVDAKPKSTMALRRLANISANPSVSMVVDHYDDRDWTQLWWVRVDGRARVVETGPEREVALDALAAKYEQYRAQRPPGAVIAITPTIWRTWQ